MLDLDPLHPVVLCMNLMDFDETVYAKDAFEDAGAPSL